MEKNLHATIPPKLLMEAQMAASADKISMDELIKDAVEQRLRDRRRRQLYAYGGGRVHKLGIHEEDVDRIVHEFRDDERQRLLGDNGP